MPPPREKYLDTVAAYLAEEQARKAGKSAPRPTRVFRNDPAMLRGLETADVYPDKAVLGRRPDSDRAALEAEGYEWRPVDEYSTVVAHPQVPVDPPPGKLPFISGTPTHGAPKGYALSTTPSRWDPKMAGVVDQMNDIQVPASAPAAPPPLDMPATAPATKKRAGRREAMLVSKTTETGSTPTARPYTPLDTSAPAPAQDRFQGLPEGVATLLRKRSGLEEAQQDANRRSMAVELASAFNQVGAGIGGSRYNPNAFDNQREAAQQPVADYQARAEEGRTEDALARQHTMDEQALQEAARHAQQQEREFQYRQGRDVAGDALKREGMGQEMEIAKMRASDASKDRWMRHQELLLRAKEGQQARADLAEQKRKDMLGRQNEKDLAEFATREAAAGETAADIRTLNDAITKGQQEGDVPGLGVWDSWKMNSQGALAKGARALFASPDDYAVSGAVNRLSGNENRAMTGLASSDSEREENKRRRGLDAGSAEEAAVQGAQTLARDVRTRLRKTEAGFGKDVVDEYATRGGETSRDIPDPVVVRRAGARTLTLADGSVWQESPTGEAEMISPPVR